MLQRTESSLVPLREHTDRLTLSPYTLFLFRLGTMLTGLSSHLLVQDLRLVHARCRHTVSFDHLIQTDLASDLAHAFSVSCSNPDRPEQNIHLLQREAFGFREEEVDKSSPSEGQYSKENVSAPLQMLESIMSVSHW
jgi:hypothetical protein